MGKIFLREWSPKVQVNQLLSYCRDVSENGRRHFSSAYRYSLQGTRAAFVSTSIALAAILLTGSTFQPTAYTLFLGAIILSAYHGGVYAGVLSLILSTFFLACLHFVTPATQTFSSLDMAASVVLLSLAGLLACFLAGECRGGARKLDEQRRNLAHTKEGLIVLDEMLRVKHINQAAQALTGWTEKDALNRSLESVAGLSAQQSGQALRVPWANLLAAQPGAAPTNEKVAGSAVLVTRDGKERYVDYWVEVVANTENGKDACFFFHDTSERREHDERNQRVLEQHRRLAENLPAPFFFLDQNNRCTLQNKAWQDLAGPCTDDKIVQTVASKLNPLDPQFAANWSKALRERTKYTTEFQVRGGLNPVRHFRFESLPVRGEGGEPLGQVGMLIEHTQQKQSEAELAKKQQELLNLQKLLHQCETEANEQIVALEKVHQVLQQDLTREQNRAAELAEEVELLRAERAQFDAGKMQELEELARVRIEQITGELQGSKRATARVCQILDLVQANLPTGVICWEDDRQLPIIDKNAGAILDLPGGVEFNGRWSDCIDVLQADGETLVKDKATPFALAEKRKPFRDMEVHVRTRQGTARTLLVSGAVLHDDKRHEVGFVLVLRDVSEHKQTAAERDSHYQRLLAAEQDSNKGRLLVQQHAARINELTTACSQLEEASAGKQAELEAHILRLLEMEQTLDQNRLLVQQQTERINELTTACSDLEEELALRQAEQAKREEAARTSAAASVDSVSERALAFARRLTEQLRDLSGLLCKQSEREQIEEFRKKSKLRLMHMNVLAESLRSTLHVPERTAERLEPVEMSQVVNRVVSTWKRVLHASTRQLVVSLPSKPLWLVGSGQLLGLATEILVDIACHNSEPEAYIDLSLNKDEANMVLSVKDRGRGFSTQELDYLRNGAAPAEKPDAGLDALRAGIAFVSSLAELHKGRLEVESGGRGKGCVFRLRLPQDANAGQTNAAEQPGNGRQTSLAAASG